MVSTSKAHSGEYFSFPFTFVFILNIEDDVRTGLGELIGLVMT